MYRRPASSIIIYKDLIVFNHFITGPTRLQPERWTHLGEGFFPHYVGGVFELANLPNVALPYPSYPALSRQDTTYAWRPAFGSYPLSEQSARTTGFSSSSSTSQVR